MADELVERLLDWPYQGETMAHEAADRIKQLTAERDKAYASGYSDAETEISKSALGQRVAFLNAEYANAAARIKALTADFARQVHRTDEQRESYEQALSVMEAERDEALADGRKYEGAWMTAEGRLADAEAERNQWVAHAKNAVWTDSAELKLVEADNARLRAALELDPWFVGREAWKKYASIALTGDTT